MKLLVDETDLFYLRCAASDFLIEKRNNELFSEVYKALQNTKLRDLKNDANRSECTN